jgi:hypothetical protein
MPSKKKESSVLFQGFDAKYEAYHNRICVAGAIGGEIGRQMRDDDQSTVYQSTWIAKVVP